MKVAVVGLGYVGTVTAACLASNGHDVWGVDVDATKVDEICAGRSPVAEPGLDALVAQAVAGGDACTRRRRAPTLSTGLRCRSCVSGRRRRRAAARTCPTSGAPWTTSWRRCAVVRHRRRSTASSSAAPCRPGTVEDVVIPALTGGLAGTGIAIGAAMCPEFLREGSGIADFFASPFARRWDLRSRGRRDGQPTCSAFSTSLCESSTSASPRRSNTPATRSMPPRCPSPMRCRGCSGYWAWIPARSCRCSARTRSSTSRRAICAPDSPSADPACPRTSGPCCTWPG